LIDIADLGLVYTTTVGMEMAMSGVPTIVAGHTHYRGKGFTLDPAGWEEFFELLNQALMQKKVGQADGLSASRHPQSEGRPRLSRDQVDLAWQYAYRFFFTYPLAFPWHMLYFYDELNEWPLEKALGVEGQAAYAEAWSCLAGRPRQWLPTVPNGSIGDTLQGEGSKS
jgi:hypothetical protein